MCRRSGRARDRLSQMLSDGGPTTDRAAGIERAEPGEVRVRRALLSVSDKRGIVDFAAVVVDPTDYQGVLSELRECDGRLSLETRTRLAAKAFACTARYDVAIASWFAMRVHGEGFPPTWADAYEKISDLRYGENPHQRAAFYARVGAPTHLLDGVGQLHGKELSFNNLLDLNSARQLAEAFEAPACAIVKHNNPCGCATSTDVRDAYERPFA